jgi:hypothetical protein
MFFGPGRKGREKKEEAKPRVEMKAQSKGNNQQTTTNLTGG